MNDVTRPKITIGLPVYNGAKFIHNAISSLLKQSYTNFELLISDNASLLMLRAQLSGVTGYLRYLTKGSFNGGKKINKL